MNVSSAKELLLSLQREAHLDQPLEPQILNLFVKALFHPGAVLANSWRGRIASCFTLHQSKQVKNRHIKEAFAQALESLKDQQKAASEISFSLRLKLHRLLDEEGLILHKHNLEPLIEWQQVSEAFEEQKAENEKQKNQHSLFRQLNPHPFSLSLDQVNALFSDDLTGLEDYTAYLKTHPHYAHPQINGRFALLQEALSQRQKLQLEFNITVVQDYLVKRLEHAQQLTATVQNLAVNQKWMFCGSYGQQQAILQILQILKKLPESVIDSLGTSAANWIKQDQIPHPQEFINLQLREHLSPLKQKAGEWAQTEAETLSKWGFFEDSERSLPANLTAQLSPYLEQHLNSWLQEGLLKGILEFVPDGAMREWGLWAAEQGAINIPEQRTQFIQDLENQITSFIQKQAQDKIITLDRVLKPFLQNIQQIIPYELQLGLDIAKQLTIGAFWLEFEKQADGLYIVKIYSTGQALSQHSQSTEGQYHWPLILTHVKPEKLNEKFFDRLLYHSFDPQFNLNHEVVAKDLYEGLIEYLEGTPNTQNHELWQHVSTSLPDHCLPHLFLSNPRIDVTNVLFEMKWEAFFNFCSSYLTKKQSDIVLSFPDLKTVEAVNRWNQQILKEAQIKQVYLGKERWSQINGTCEEVQAAILAFQRSNTSADNSPQVNGKQPPLQLPAHLLKTLRSVWADRKITPNQVEALKSTLCWALGEEIGDFVDALVETIECTPQPSQNSATERSELRSATPPANRPQGWIRTFLFNTYVAIAWKAMRIILMMMKLPQHPSMATWIIQEMSQFAGYYVPASWQNQFWNAAQRIKDQIPPPIQRLMSEGLSAIDQAKAWYQQVMRILRQKMAEKVLDLILQAFIKPDEVDELKAFCNKWKDSIQDITHILMQNQPWDDPFKTSLSAPAVEISSEILPEAECLSLSTLHELDEKLVEPWHDLDRFLGPDTCLSILHTWLSAIQQHSQSLKSNSCPIKTHFFRQKKALFILQLIKKLPIPIKEPNSFWLQIKPSEISAIIEALTHISLLLRESIILINDGDNPARLYPMKPFIQSQYVVGLYTILAGIDQLSRRCPEADLEGYEINSYKLLEWLRLQGTEIEEPWLLDRLQKVCQYFYSDIDIFELPSIEEIRMRASKTLFDYAFLKKSACWGESINNSSIQFSHDKNEHTHAIGISNRFALAVPEIRYLQHKENEFEVKRKINSYTKEHGPLTDLDILGLLFSSSFPHSPHQFLPLPYTRLRFQTLLCNQAVNEGYRIHPKYLPNVHQGDAYITHFESSLSRYKDSKLEKLVKVVEKDVLRVWYLYILKPLDAAFIHNPVHELKGRCHLASESIGIQAGVTKSEKQFSQSVIMRHYGSEEHKLIRMIFCEEEDRLVRALSYLQTHLQDLLYSEYLYFLQNQLFTASALKKQLLAAPAVAEAIGRFFSNGLKYLARERNWPRYMQLVYVGRKAEMHCAAYAPNHLSTFPHFRRSLELPLSQLKEGWEKALLFMIEAFTVKTASNSFSQEREELMALAKAFIYYMNQPTNISTNLLMITDFALDVQTMFFARYWELMPKMQELLEDQIFAECRLDQILLDEIMKPYPVKFKDHSSWKKVRLGLYQKEHIFVDVLKGQIQGINQNNPLLVLALVEKKLKEFFKFDSAALIMTSPLSFEYTFNGGMLKIDLTVKDSQIYEWNCLRCQEGKIYRQVKPCFLRVYQLLGEKRNWRDSFWVEQTENIEKQLLIYDYEHSQVIANCLIEQKDPSNNFSGSLKAIIVKGEPLQLVDYANYSLQLAPFVRFCPISQMQCWIDPQKNQLRRIDFLPYQLSFTIKQEGKDLKASHDSLFSGYIISKYQSHPDLKYLPAYLLMENEMGQKKVLCPYQSWDKIFLWRGLSHLGSLSAFAYLFIQDKGLFQFGKVEKGYAVYELEERGLVSDQPKELFYLLSLYLAQEQQVLAEQVCQQIEMLCRKEAVTQDFYQQCILLAFVPPSFAWIREIRQRVMAALDENALINVKKVETNKNKKSTAQNSKQLKPSILIDLTWSLIAILDLKENQNQKEISSLRPDQEWFLFKGIFRRINRVIKFTDQISKPGKAVLKKIGHSNVLAALAIPMSLNLRYEELKQKFGDKTFPWMKVWGGMRNFMAAPSTISQLVNPMSQNQFFNLSRVDRSIRGNTINLVQGVREIFNEPNYKLLVNRMCKGIIELSPENLQRGEPDFFISHFFSYYALARGSGQDEKKQILKQFLRLNKGGWDAETRLLIQCLETVLRFPKLFLTIDKLQERIDATAVRTINFFLHHSRLGIASIINGCKLIDPMQQILNPPPLEAAIDRDFFISHFLSYYALAHLDKQEALSKNFEQFLLSFKDGQDPQTKMSMQCLEAAFNFPDAFPSVEEIQRMVNLAAAQKGLLMTKIKFGVHEPDSPSNSQRGNPERLILIDPSLEDLSKINQTAFISHFFSYYALARVDGHEEKKQKLMQFLTSDKEGWTSHARMFLKFLDAVCHFPALFPPLEDLAELKKTGEELSNFYFEHSLKEVKEWAQICSVSSDILGLSLKHGFKWGFGRILNGEISPLKNNFSFLTRSLIQAGEKAYHAYQQIPASRATLPIQETEVFQTLTPTYSYLDVEDRHFDAIFSELFDLAFVEVPVESRHFTSEKRMHPFTVQEQAGSEASFLRVNENIYEYYGNPERLSPYLYLRDKESLWMLYLSLSQQTASYEQQLNQDLEGILRPLNQGLGGNKAVVFDDLKWFFLKGSASKLTSKVALPPLAWQHLEQGIARYIVRKTRLQQMQKCLQHVCSLIEDEGQENQQNFESKLELLAHALKMRRAYGFSQLAPRLLRRYMLFEVTTQNLLWVPQADCISDLLLGQHGDAVIELLMSLGKTYFGIPTIDSFEANGKQIIFNVWPAGMAKTNISQISKQSKLTFNQLINTLTFHRQFPMKEKNLEAIFVVLQRALEGEETIHLTMEEAQALRLMFVDHLYQYRRTSNDKDKQKAQISLLKLVLGTIRKIGKVVGDEAHELFDDTKELNYPLGPPSHIKDEYYLIMQECLRLIGGHFQFILALFQKDLNLLFKTKDYTEIVEQAAIQMACYPKFGLSKDQQQEFVSYVQEKLDYIPEWIEKHALRSEMGLVKGVLGQLLDLIMERTMHVDYGPSFINRNNEFAIPFIGNTNPREKSSIRNPYEAMIKTFFMYLHEGLTEAQTGKLVTYLALDALKEMKKQPMLDLEKTESCQVFKKMYPRGDLIQLFQSGIQSEEWKAMLHFFKAQNEAILAYIESDVFKKAGFQSEEGEALLQACRHRNEAIFAYNKIFAYKQILYWKKSATANAQNFDSMFHSRVYDTGTPYNWRTYPATKMLWRPGTIGEALHILNKKCPSDGIHVLEQSKPQAILQDVLHRFFKPGSNFTALIDGGAQLKGLDNYTVAKEMLLFVRQYRPDIQVIDFFLKDLETGKDQLVSWQVGADKPISYELCKVNLKARLTYFDQCHGFAANAPQKNNGKGLHLLGERHTLYALLQEVFRMRGIKVFKKLLGIGDEQVSLDELDRQDLETTQTIEFAMTQSVKQLINQGSETPTLREIVIYAIKNECDILKERDYHAYLHKIDNVSCQAVLDKMLFAEDLEDTFKMAEEFEDLLITTTEDDPWWLYGLIRKAIPAKDVIEYVKNESLKSIQKSSFFTDQENQQLKSQIDGIPIPPMAETIKIATNGTQLFVNSDLNKEVTHEQNQELDHHLDVELENNIQQESESSSIPKFKEVEWPKQMDPQDLEWLINREASHGNFPDRLNNLGIPITTFFPSLIRIPPIFSLREILSQAPHPHLQSVAMHIDRRLWATPNFFGHQTPQLHIGTKAQREVYEVLVHLEEEEAGSYSILFMGCLSQKEMAYWRNQLKEIPYHSTSPRKIILYDIKLRTMVAGHFINLARLKKHSGFLKLEAQLKLLNGDTHYEKDQQTILIDWMKEANPSLVKTVFDSIHAERNPSETISGSDWDYVCRFFFPSH